MRHRDATVSTGMLRRRPTVVDIGLGLFAWADAQRARRRMVVPPRVILLHDATAPDGLPRAALLLPGARLPVVFPSLPATLAAIAEMEARA
jgi:hypothetical protein